MKDGRERLELIRDKTSGLFVCFNKPEHRIVIPSYLSKASMEEGQCGLKVPEKKMEWKALGGNVEKKWTGDLHSFVSPQTETAILPERCWPFPEATGQEKENTPP